IVLGLFIGLLNMVPYLQTIGVVPAVMLAAMTAFEKDGSLVWYLVGVGIVFAVVQTTQDALLTPRIMGKVTGLRPAVILFSVLFWGKLLGMLGLVLAIPLSCLGLAYYRRLLARQEEVLRSATSDEAQGGNAP
ncbi:MAG: AI-2E family transporter, partial [Phycisphaerales bacterium]